MNLSVYIFWIVVSRWFNKRVQLSVEIIQQLRRAFTESLASINVGYLVKLQHKYMDGIQELLPYVLALMVRGIFDSKVKDNDLNLN